MGRSSAYWTANLYPSENDEPEPAAPLEDLPPAAASRFQLVRQGLLELEGVAEQVRYMGSIWRWAWEYGIGNRKLCWLHIMKHGIDVTFTLSDSDQGRLGKVSRLSAVLLRVIEEGQRTGPLKWCWMELGDRRSIDGFLSLARRKAEWLAERPTPRRAPKLHGGSRGEGIEAD